MLNSVSDSLAGSPLLGPSSLPTPPLDTEVGGTVHSLTNARKIESMGGIKKTNYSIGLYMVDAKFRVTCSVCAVTHSGHCVGVCECQKA